MNINIKVKIKDIKQRLAEISTAGLTMEEFIQLL